MAAPGRAGVVCVRPSAAGWQVLLVRSSDGRRWTLPKGVVGRGERRRVAALRELAEEAGVHALLGPRLCDVGKGRRRVRWFLGTYDRPAGAPEEGRDPTWVALGRAAALLEVRRSRRAAARLSRVLLAAGAVASSVVSAA